MPDTVITKYPFVLVTVATRKEGLTREQFRKHNEEVYAPLLKKVAGKLHPLAWTRRYHVDEDEGPKGIPRMIIGTEEGLDWDCFGEMVSGHQSGAKDVLTILKRRSQMSYTANSSSLSYKAKQLSQLSKKKETSVKWRRRS